MRQLPLRGLFRRIRNQGERHANDDSRTERGAVVMEAAIVFPVLIILVLGIMEFGLAFASTSTTTASSRSGARLAATAYPQAGSTPTNQQATADQIAAAVSADLKALNNATPIGMVIYRVDPSSTEGAPVGGFPGDNMVGGCSANCFWYTWSSGTMTYSSGGWSNPDACGSSVDSIGVYVQVEHDYVTKFMGDSRIVDGHTVMRLEPLPTDQCS